MQIPEKLLAYKLPEREVFDCRNFARIVIGVRRSLYWGQYKQFSPNFDSILYMEFLLTLTYLEYCMKKISITPFWTHGKYFIYQIDNS